MSIFEEMHQFHEEKGVHPVVETMDRDTLKQFLEFRLGCMQEEIEEVAEAIDERDADGVVDGIIDLIVFAAGTLDLYGVDGYEAWEEVMTANFDKEVGVKPGRPNPYGLPDLVKPDGWKAPSHESNLGRIEEAFDGN